jgi:phosphopentomutase
LLSDHELRNSFLRVFQIISNSLISGTDILLRNTETAFFKLSGESIGRRLAHPFIVVFSKYTLARKQMFKYNVHSKNYRYLYRVRHNTEVLSCLLKAGFIRLN